MMFSWTLVLLVVVTLILSDVAVHVHALMSSPPPKPHRITAERIVPEWWKDAWSIAPSSEAGAPGSPIGFNDFLFGIRSSLEETWFLTKEEEEEATDATNNDCNFYEIPQAQKISPSTMQTNFFHSLRQFRQTVGNVFQVTLGIQTIIYIADPLAVKTILLKSGSYDKGLLGFVGGDVFGDGLITALDRTVWQRRRKAVAPTVGANSNWLSGLIEDFSACTKASFDTLDRAALTTIPSSNATTAPSIDLEETMLAIALDALGVTVFGTQFKAANSLGQEGGDPLVQAVYRVLKETNLRSENPVNIVAAALRPKWLAEALFPSLREFRDASRFLDAKMNDLIADLKVRTEQGMAAADSETPSILRVLVETRDGETTSQQVKDDLITLLIAGHETVASVLTWTFYELAKNPIELQKLQDEIDYVLGFDNDSAITMQDVLQLQATRRALTESLRLYPAPPLLSRRALSDEIVPLTDGVSPPLRLKRGDNMFLLTAMLQRDPRIYGDDAEVFRPDRWASPITSNLQTTPTWKGYEGPDANPRDLYPSEKATDFALIGFGAGEFKCVGDKFAFVEATVVLALMLQRYTFELVTEDVGFDMAGTIHTRDGLMVRVQQRPHIAKANPAASSNDGSQNQIEANIL